MKTALFLLPLAVVVAGCIHVNLDGTHSSTSHQTTVGGSAAQLSLDHATQQGPGPASNRDWWALEYHTRNGHAVLETEKIALVFEELSRDQQRVFKFKDTRQPIKVGGDGTFSVSTSCRHNSTFVAFCSNYVNGTNTIQLGKDSVQIVNTGKTLIANGKTIDLVGERQTVYVKSGRIAAK